MTVFLQTIAEDEAKGRVAEIYSAQRAQSGMVMEATRCFTARPDLLPAYMDFVMQARGNFSLSQRDWRIITFIAARDIPSTYCSHVYGRQLIDELGSRAAVLAVQRDHRNAGLSERDVAMLDYAEKITRDASRITIDDIGRLRDAGFSDTQICDIALCASFRSFVSRFFDAVGAVPEDAFLDSDEEFRTAMTVGKPI
jgi:uncharacterized peroxidase-related enzyme